MTVLLAFLQHALDRYFYVKTKEISEDCEENKKKILRQNDICSNHYFIVIKYFLRSSVTNSFDPGRGTVCLSHKMALALYGLKCMEWFCFTVTIAGNVHNNCVHASNYLKHVQNCTGFIFRSVLIAQVPNCVYFGRMHIFIYI